MNWWQVQRPSYRDEFEVVWPLDMRTFSAVDRNASRHANGQYARKASKRAACRAWLDATLERGSLTSTELKLEAKREGYSVSTLKTVLQTARCGDAPTVGRKYEPARNRAAGVVYYRRPVSLALGD